ncbi:MAG TPA: molybdate ABC transporter substrate-binding protein [Patescibacteria group bacterium]|nr:molybdate ABC transporter substrate-binding protein [Patescibacteria group bacterium]
MKVRVVLVLAVIAIAAGCQFESPTRLGLASTVPSPGGQTSPALETAQAGGPAAALTIYAAASLQVALQTIAASYEAGHPGTTLTISTGSSAALATQIEQGAPADVFLSADITNPRKLVDKGLADGDPVNFAGNHLVIAVPADNSAGLASPADLARPGLKVIAAGDDVPITTYATQVVGLLAKLPGYPAGFSAAYAANVVSKEDDVQAVITKIELGEGDAAIVYLTDARGSSTVSAIAIPAEADIAAVYAGAVLNDSPNLAAAHAFLDWMTGAEAQLILAQLGFTEPAS